MKCNRCGKVNDPEASFCEQCGASLQSLTCPKCGKENKPDSKFCKHCGQALDQPALPPAPQSPAATPPSTSKPVATPRRGVPAWGWALIALAALVILVPALFLILKPKGASVVETSTPTASLTKTATPTGITTNTPTPTPTPIGAGTGRIAFYNYGGTEDNPIRNIYSVNADGSGLAQLTNFSDPKMGIAFLDWSPDGQFLLFDRKVLYGQYSTFQLFILSPNAPYFLMRPISRGSGNQTTDFQSSWSPDGKFIIFSSNRQNTPLPPRIDLFTLNLETNDLAQLTQMEGTTVIYRPVYSPNMQQIAFIATMPSSNFSGILYVINADGTGLRNLVDTCGAGEGPVFSPNGEYLAFSSACDSATGIFIIRPDGTGLQQLTDTADYSPLWSPDGSKILFVSTRDENSDLYIINANGSNEFPLVVNPDSINYGSWSPDGQWIAFTSDRDGDYEVYIIKTDGTGLAQLTNNQTPDYNPIWQPPVSGSSPEMPILGQELVNPQIGDVETFDDWTGEDWSVSENASISQGDNKDLMLPGEISFDSWAVSPAIEPGQGILVRFKLSGTQAEFFLAQNQWDTPDYRRFGGALYGQSLMETSIWEGQDNQLSNQVMEGPLVFAPDHWYGLFIGVNQEQVFHFLVWDWEDPGQFARHEFQGDDTWEVEQWNFIVQVIEGPIFLDDFGIVSFDGFTNP